MDELKMLQGCNFCVRPGDKTDIFDSTVVESDYFRAFPTLGMITEGYLLVVSKDHRACMGALPDEMMKDLQKIKSEVDELLTQKYQKPVWFEHGGIGQTVFHAHMHAVPASLDGKALEFYRRDFHHELQLWSLTDLREVWNRLGMYLFHEENGEMRAFYTKVAPMYARIVVADILGVPERANWRTMDRDLDNRIIADTIRKLRS